MQLNEEILLDNLLLNITTKIEQEVTDLKQVDENWGQIQYFGPDCPVKWPCALVDFASGQFSNMGYDYKTETGTQQEGLINIEITVAKLKLSPTNTAAKLSQKTKGFEVWRLIEKVHKILHGWKPLPNSGELSRVSIQSIKRDDGVQEKIITYSLALHGC
ncbi:hypothetical protein EGI16_21410 [Chryseobacterium sp. G0240]|uniref:hypothetical protein n=1 Tax=Chryseobacterium sp. G0240 TaxID=2487066 RepID=UPI000F45643E|nr:hypothetical protein [Chryseobacterium sp. G0240]ROH98396.1 hypothetical protein EGI16_21410 [Chryseobacterium sp. G0240]